MIDKVASSVMSSQRAPIEAAVDGILRAIAEYTPATAKNPGQYKLLP